MCAASVVVAAARRREGKLDPLRSPSRGALPGVAVGAIMAADFPVDPVDR